MKILQPSKHKELLNECIVYGHLKCILSELLQCFILLNVPIYDIGYMIDILIEAMFSLMFTQ